MILREAKRTRRAIQHVVYNLDGGWSVVKEGAARASRNFDKKEDAISRGRMIAERQSGELVVHNRDGSIREVNSYAVNPTDRGSRKQ